MAAKKAKSSPNASSAAKSAEAATKAGANAGANAGAKKESAAEHRRGAEARAKNMATGRGKTPSKTAETSGSSKRGAAQPGAKPRNARKDNETVAPGASKDTKGKASYELESSNPSKRPSRKSTRGSANRAKPDSQLKNRQTRAVRSPQARSQSRAG